MNREAVIKIDGNAADRSSRIGIQNRSIIFPNQSADSVSACDCTFGVGVYNPTIVVSDQSGNIFAPNETVIIDGYTFDLAGGVGVKNQAFIFANQSADFVVARDFGRGVGVEDVAVGPDFSGQSANIFPSGDAAAG